MFWCLGDEEENGEDGGKGRRKEGEEGALRKHVGMEEIAIFGRYV